VIKEAAVMAEDSTAAIAVLARPDVQVALARGDWSVVLRAFLDTGVHSAYTTRTT
jgi:hypothetical protein